MTQNLISVSKLDVDGFLFKFRNNKIIIYHYSHVIGSGSLEGNFYKINLDDVFVESLLTMNVTKSTSKSEK